MPNRFIRVEVAGLSFHNSQKIHNWLEGLAVAAPASKYVMCLDDDIKLYRDSLATLVSSLDEDPQARSALSVCLLFCLCLLFCAPWQEQHTVR